MAAGAQMSNVKMSDDHSPPCFVYVIKAGQLGPFKVGRSSNVNVRLVQLQTGSAAKLAVVHTEEMDEEASILVEKNVHRLLSGFKISGVGDEWFDTTTKQVIWAVTLATGFMLGQRAADKVWIDKLFDGKIAFTDLPRRTDLG